MDFVLQNKDCLIGLKSVKEKSIRLIFCDLPYGCTAEKWDKQINMGELWQEFDRILLKDGVVAFTATFRFAEVLYNSRKNGFRYELVWEKGRAVGFLNCKYQPLRSHELILIFSSKGRHQYIPQMTPGKPYVSKGKKKGSIYHLNDKYSKVTINKGVRYPRSVLRFADQRDMGLHPTQKPIGLMKWLINTFTRPGEYVLDPTAGSASTGVACIETGRNFIGFERDPEFFRRATTRLLKVQEDIQK